MKVIEWDVIDGDVLGAIVACPECPCRSGTGCDGTGRLHRPYRLPGGHHIDLYRDADLLVGVLDRSVTATRERPGDPDENGSEEAGDHDQEVPEG